MHKILNIVTKYKVPDWWVTSWPVDLGDLYLRENWYLPNPRAVQSSSIFLEKDIIKNRNSTGTKLSPCLTPTLKSVDHQTFLMMSLTMLLLCMRLIGEHSLGGAPYFPSMEMISALLEGSKALNMSANTTHAGRL